MAEAPSPSHTGPPGWGFESHRAFEWLNTLTENEMFNPHEVAGAKMVLIWGLMAVRQTSPTFCFLHLLPEGGWPLCTDQSYKENIDVGWKTCMGELHPFEADTRAHSPPGKNEIWEAVQTVLACFIICLESVISSGHSLVWALLCHLSQVP